MKKEELREVIKKNAIYEIFNNDEICKIFD